MSETLEVQTPLGTWPDKVVADIAHDLDGQFAGLHKAAAELWQEWHTANDAYQASEPHSGDAQYWFGRRLAAEQDIALHHDDWDMAEMEWEAFCAECGVNPWTGQVDDSEDE